MGAVLLRAQVCLNCGRAMSTEARIDRRYCKASCRTLAYRIRKRSGLSARPRTAVPRWVDGQPPTIASVLAALAELQARVLHIAHHVEQDDIAFRHTCPTREQKRDAEPAIDTKPLEARIQELEQELAQAQRSLQQATDEQATTARELQRLEASRQHDHATLEAARQQVHAAEARQYDLDDQLRTMRDIARERFGRIQELENQLEDAQSSQKRRGSKASPERKAARWEAAPTAAPAPVQPDPAVMRKLGQLEGENRTLQGMVRSQTDLKGVTEELLDRTADLSATGQQLQKQLADIGQALAASNAEMAKLRQTSQKVEPLRETIRDQKAQLHQAARENRDLQAEVQRLQPSPHETDPLTLRMRDRVLAVHRLATMQREAHRLGIGRLFLHQLDLPTQPLNISDDRAVWAATLQMTAHARRRYAANPPPLVGKPQWVHVDRQLDPASEAELLKILESDISTLTACERAGRMRLRSNQR